MPDDTQTTSDAVETTHRRVHDSNYVLNELKSLVLGGDATTRSNVKRVHDDHERTFVAAFDADLGSDESVNFRVSNPDAADRAMYFYHGELTHQDSVEVTLHTEVSDVVEDTALEANNNYVGSGVESVADVFLAASFTSQATHFEQDYFAGGTEIVFDGYRVTVPPGESVLLEILNLGGNNAVGARFSWAESALLTE